MTRYFLLQAFLAIGILSASNASAQPFGLAMGTGIEELDIQASDDRNIRHSLASVPAGHSEFELYIAKANKEDGLCEIMAIGMPHNIDEPETNVIAAFESIKGEIGTTYGQTDTMAHWDVEDSKFREDGKITDAIANRHLLYFATWRSSLSKALSNNVKHINLQLGPRGNDTLQVVLTYQFENHKKCSR